MQKTTGPDIKAQLAALDDMFEARLGEQIRQIGDGLHCVRTSVHAYRGEHLRNLHRQLHTLAGASGIFGFDELGVRAAILESQLALLLKAEDGFQEKLSAFEAQTANFLTWAAANSRREKPRIAVK